MRDANNSVFEVVEFCCIRTNLYGERQEEGMFVRVRMRVLAREGSNEGEGARKQRGEHK